MMRELLLQDLSLWGCLWQSVAFIALGLVASYLLRRRPSRAYQVLLFVMMAAAVVPLMSAVVKHFDMGVFTARATESFGTPLEGPEAIPLAGTDDLAGMAVPDAVSPAGINSGPAEITFARHSIEWRAVAVYGWMIATLAMLTRLIVTFMYGAYIVRNAQRPGCEQMQQTVDDVTLNLGLSCGLQVRGSRRIRSPIVWCWSRPSILLVPNSCWDPRVDWSGVVAHELAHCKRWDHITGLIAELMVCLLPWNPLMWLSKKCLVRLGEQACDDWVVATDQPSEDYAESLLRFRPQSQMAFLPAVVHSKKGLAGRVDRILKDSCANPRTGTKWALVVSIMAVCIAAGVALAQTRPAETETNVQPETKPDDALHEAVSNGDIEQVKLHLSIDTATNTKDRRGRTTLHNAASKGYTEIASLLIAKGADVNAGARWNLSAAEFAMRGNHNEVVELLISKGADISPLHFALHMKDRAEAKRLIESGADVNRRDPSGTAPLDMATGHLFTLQPKRAARTWRSFSLPKG